MARPSSALEPSDPPAGTVATFFRISSDPGTGPVDAWTTRTHGLICTPVDSGPALTLPTHACAGWCIGSCFGLNQSPVSHLRDTIRFDLTRLMDPQGFEPWASSLQRRHSTTELWAHPELANGELGDQSGVLALTVLRCPLGQTLVRTVDTTSAWAGASPRSRSVEVIQPQIPLRLPCYDFTPVLNLKLNNFFKNLFYINQIYLLLLYKTPFLHSLSSHKINFHGMTGGVY